MGWLQREWEQIAPNLKYDIYRWAVIVGGGGVVTLAVIFMRALRRIPEPAFYGTLFIVACWCFWFLARHLPPNTYRQDRPKDATPVTATPSANAAPTSQRPESLSDRIDALAKGLFGFLRSCGEGEEPVPSLGYIIRVHNGFLRDWYPQVEAIAYDIGIAGILDFKFSELVGSHHDAFSYDKIRKIAEALVQIKHKMELDSYKTPTLTQKEIDQMSAAELRRRLESDPEFGKQVEALGFFKRLS